MELNAFQRIIAEKLSEIELRFNENLSKHTSFRIGGPAEVMAFPKTPEEVSIILKVSVELDIKPAILGAGTNILAPDDGLTGLVICLKDCLSGIRLIDSTHLEVMAGVTMSRTALYAAKSGLSGMEFAHGIPGSVGGGVFMNAGAYGGDISQICESVCVMNRNGEMRILSNNDMCFSYRHSVLKETGEIVISAVFSLHSLDEETVKATMRELQKKRSSSQPLDLPSAGSAFKRPQGGYAAALIDQSGLKGFRVGQAGISDKHAGFAVNLGGATAKEVKELLEQTAQIVYKKTGIELEPEIVIW